MTEDMSPECETEFEEALNALAMKELPQLYIGPPKLENKRITNPAVDGLSLVKAYAALGFGSLADAGALEPCQDRFFHRLLCCLAARRGLVLVDRWIRFDGLTPKFLTLVLSAEDMAFLLLQVTADRTLLNTCGSEEQTCMALASKEDLLPKDLMFYDLISEDEPASEDESLRGEWLHFRKLVPKDKLRQEPYPQISSFLAEAHSELDMFFVKDTPLVRHAAAEAARIGKL